MSKRNPQIDHIILNAQPFAKPILIYFRNLMHEICPEVEEKIKWGMPHFDYKGQMMCHMAAFKKHCAIGFFKAALIDEKLVEMAKSETAMGHLGKITSISEMPNEKIIAKWIKGGMKLNEAGIKIPKSKVTQAVKLTAPDDLLKAINKNKQAKINWNNFSPSHQKEYIQWITEAKTDTTKMKRTSAAIELIAEGKGKNWKYAAKQ